MTRATQGCPSGQGQAQKVGSDQERSELHSRCLEGGLVHTSKDSTVGGRSGEESKNKWGLKCLRMKELYHL